MRRYASQLGTLAGGLAAIAMTAGILLAGAAAINSSPAGSGIDFVLETPETVPDFEETAASEPGDGEMPFEEQNKGDVPVSSGEPADQAATDEHQFPRQVAPDSFALPGDVQSQPLERIEPRVSLPVPVEPEDKKKAERTLLPQPVAVSAGRIRFGNGTIDLEGIVAPSLDQTCAGASGREWPCGRMARTALRNFIGGRALSCGVAAAEWEGTVAASCSQSDHDLALWLVENGWAEAAPGSAFEDQADAARKEKRGIFGDDPRRSGGSGAGAVETPDTP